MDQQVPTIGRIVNYRLSPMDVANINRRRTDEGAIAQLNERGQWPKGAQAHVGNDVHEGDVFPMMITRVWGAYPEAAVNGQVFLDGSDSLWVTSVSVGEGPRTFSWPVRG